jgi:hypothetical protein
MIAAADLQGTKRPPTLSARSPSSIYRADGPTSTRFLNIFGAFSEASTPIIALGPTHIIIAEELQQFVNLLFLKAADIFAGLDGKTRGGFLVNSSKSPAKRRQNRRSGGHAGKGAKAR